MISSLCLSMIFAQTRFVFVREGKPVSTFPDHAVVLLRHKTLMVRRRSCAVSKHEGHVAYFRASSFETLARASSSG